MEHIKTYTPEMVIIKKDHIYDASSCIERSIGILEREIYEFKSETHLAMDHQKKEYERMNRELDKFKKSLKNLNDFVISEEHRS